MVRLSVTHLNFGNIKLGCTYVQSVQLIVTSGDRRSGEPITVRQPKSEFVWVRLRDTVSLHGRRVRHTWWLDVYVAASKLSALRDDGVEVFLGVDVESATPVTPASRSAGSPALVGAKVVRLPVVANVLEPKAFERMWGENPDWMHGSAVYSQPPSSPRVRVVSATAEVPPGLEDIVIGSETLREERAYEKTLVPCKDRLSINLGQAQLPVFKPTSSPVRTSNRRGLMLEIEKPSNPTPPRIPMPPMSTRSMIPQRSLRATRHYTSSSVPTSPANLAIPLGARQPSPPGRDRGALRPGQRRGPPGRPPAGPSAAAGVVPSRPSLASVPSGVRTSGLLSRPSFRSGSSVGSSSGSLRGGSRGRRSAAPGERGGGVQAPPSSSGRSSSSSSSGGGGGGGSSSSSRGSRGAGDGGSSLPTEAPVVIASMEYSGGSSVFEELRHRGGDGERAGELAHSSSAMDVGMDSETAGQVDVTGEPSPAAVAAAVAAGHAAGEGDGEVITLPVAKVQQMLDLIEALGREVELEQQAKVEAQLESQRLRHWIEEVQVQLQQTNAAELAQSSHALRLAVSQPRVFRSMESVPVTGDSGDEGVAKEAASKKDGVTAAIEAEEAGPDTDSPRTSTLSPRQQELAASVAQLPRDPNPSTMVDSSSDEEEEEEGLDVEATKARKRLRKNPHVIAMIRDERQKISVAMRQKALKSLCLTKWRFAGAAAMAVRWRHRYLVESAHLQRIREEYAQLSKLVLLAGQQASTTLSPTGGAYLPDLAADSAVEAGVAAAQRVGDAERALKGRAELATQIEAADATGAGAGAGAPVGGGVGAGADGGAGTSVTGSTGAASLSLTQLDLMTVSEADAEVAAAAMSGVVASGSVPPAAADAPATDSRVEQESDAAAPAMRDGDAEALTVQVDVAAPATGDGSEAEPTPATDADGLAHVYAEQLIRKERDIQEQQDEIQRLRLALHKSRDQYVRQDKMMNQVLRDMADVQARMTRLQNDSTAVGSVGPRPSSSDTTSLPPGAVMRQDYLRLK